jgi:hypothetical protein
MFGKVNRFREDEELEISVINPKYEIVKAKPKGFRIREEGKKKKEEEDYLGPGSYNLEEK